MNTRYSPVLTQPETSPQNPGSGSEVAQSLSHLSATEKRAKRTLSRTHSDYWRSRLFRRSYDQGGEQREVNDLCIRIQHGGRREFFPLHTTDQSVGAVKARDIFTFLKANGWQAALAKFKPDADGEAKLDVSIGDYLAAVDDTRKLSARTFDNYRRCLRTIVAEAFGIRLKKSQNKYDYRKGGQKAWAGRIDEIRLERLTPDRVNQWKRERVKGAGHNHVAIASARRTVNTYIRCARSLFSLPLVREIKRLKLPAPLPFDGVELEESGSQKYVSKINPHTIIAAAKNELKAGDPEAYKAFLLGLFAGMRKAEIDCAETRMLDFANNLIRLEETEWLHLKTHDSVAAISVDPEVMAELRALLPRPTGKPKKGAQFILESPHAPRPNSLRPYYRCEATFDRLYSWLRGKGIRANKPLHELRKEVGAVIATEQGIYAASVFLRHTDITTTARHYADRKTRINVGLGKFLDTTPKPAQPSARETAKAHD